MYVILYYESVISKHCDGKYNIQMFNVVWPPCGWSFLTVFSKSHSFLKSNDFCMLVSKVCSVNEAEVSYKPLIG